MMWPPYQILPFDGTQLLKLTLMACIDKKSMK